MFATHWITSTHPEIAQSVASITINFGTYERQLSALLEHLQYCPPNTPTTPRKTLSDTIKYIERSARRAFPNSALEERICEICDIGSRLNARRNILFHGDFIRSSAGGFVLVHTKSTERVIYTIEDRDLPNLDNDISRANIDLSHFMAGTANPTIPNSHNNAILAQHFWQAHTLSEPPRVLPLRKERFPSS